MIVHYEPGNTPDAPVLLLLHGTGGNETDLLELARRLAPGAALLGVRGQEQEQGMNRYFRRLAEGVFDEPNLIARTAELHGYLNEAAAQYGFDRSGLWAVGYSNGANMAGSLLFHHPSALAGAVLFHPMVPRRGIDLPDLSSVPVFIGAGSNDPLCSPAESIELAGMLKEAGAEVALFWGDGGHRITAAELEAARVWLSTKLDR